MTSGKLTPLHTPSNWLTIAGRLGCHGSCASRLDQAGETSRFREQCNFAGSHLIVKFSDSTTGSTVESPVYQQIGFAAASASRAVIKLAASAASPEGIWKPGSSRLLAQLPWDLQVIAQTMAHMLR